MNILFKADKIRNVGGVSSKISLDYSSSTS